MKKRVHVYYSGMVQGVGFRYTAERFARSHNISGWVSNLDDGRVELIAEGDDSDIDEFLSRIKVALGSYIRDYDIEWQVPIGEFNYFNIR